MFTHDPAAPVSLGATHTQGMSTLVIRDNTIPSTLEDLHDYVLLAHEKVQAYRIVLKSLDRQGAKDVYDRTLSEAQIVAEHALLAEAKLGEVLASVERRGRSYTRTTSEPLPTGIDKHLSHRAQEAYRNPEAITSVVANELKPVVSGHRFSVGRPPKFFCTCASSSPARRWATPQLLKWVTPSSCSCRHIQFKTACWPLLRIEKVTNKRS